MVGLLYEQQRMQLSVDSASVPILSMNATFWFRGHDSAHVLGYKDTKKAIKSKVDDEWRQSLQALLQTGGVKCPPDLGITTPNDLNATWISESGLYELTCSSKLPLAKAFKKWVFGKVLPELRQSGSYTVPEARQPEQAPEVLTAWTKKRLEGIELTKLKNAALQQMIEGCFGGQACGIYAIVNNIINQAVLGFKETTAKFKRERSLPDYMSIPDFLDLNGQVARGYAENAFRQTIFDEREVLRQVTMRELTTRMHAIGQSLREGFCNTGMGALRGRMLTIEDARQQKRRFAADRKNVLLQAAGSRCLVRPPKKQKTLCFVPALG